MKNRIVICLALLLSVSLSASEGFDDLVKLIKSGIGEDVQIAYIDTSKAAFDLTPDEILYLTDLGVSDKVIGGVMQRGKAVRDDPAVAEGAPEKPIEPVLVADAALPPPAEPVPALPLVLQQAENAPLTPGEPQETPPASPFAQGSTSSA